MNEKKLKIAIVHDHLGSIGGGERTVLIMAMELGADFITAYASPETFKEYQENLGDRLHILSKRIIKTRGVRFFWLRSLFWLNRKMFKKYDIIIASAPAATEAVARYARKKTSRIVYTHTTPRRIFDKYEFSKKAYPLLLQPMFAAFVKFWRWLYLDAQKKFNYNIANSECVKQRVSQHTGCEVNEVIWPPILTDNFKFITQDDYYFSWGRLDELKRIDLVVKAFQKMPDKKLIVASGGPMLEKIKELANGCENIKVLGWIDDQKLQELVGKCRAAIYIPQDEDAGMTHLEANAAGKPVLAVNEGGLIESVIDGVTGIVIPADPTVDDVIQGISRMTKEWCEQKKDNCINHARNYDKRIFIQKLRQALEKNDPSKPVFGIDASRWEDPRFPSEERRTGVEVYSKNIIESLLPMLQESCYRLRLYTPRAIPDLPSTIQKVLPGTKKWTHKHLSFELKHSPVDRFFTPSYYIPKTAPKNSFVTIHDVIFKTNPEKYSFVEGLKQDLITRINLKRARRVITVSENSKKDITKFYGIESRKVIVAPLGHNPWKDIERNNPRKKTIFYVGRIEKKKSVDVLIKAFAEFKKSHEGWNLILAGGAGFGALEINQLILELGMTESISLPGYISEQRKKEYLTEAAIFVHPGSSEGSCLPLFEAWDAKTPAIVADTPLFNEIGNEAVLTFKPDDHIDLAQKIECLSSDEQLRQNLIETGGKKLETMTWKNTAEIILNSFISLK